jgi:membrane protein insertase Oxa1/YidC/SpoIIIJ
MSRRAIPFFSINGIASEVGPPITANLLYHLDASTNDNVYNDAGVTKCTNGDTVQQWNSSNNSRFAQQLTSSEKPTFRTGGQNGKSYIEFVASPNEWLYIDTWESAYESDNYTIYVVWEAVGTNSGETYPFIMSILHLVLMNMSLLLQVGLVIILIMRIMRIILFKLIAIELKQVLVKTY